jgi:hypothetical protein
MREDKAKIDGMLKDIILGGIKDKVTKATE